MWKSSYAAVSRKCWTFAHVPQLVMTVIKTRPTGEDVTTFLDSVPHERRRAEGHTLRALFERVTGEPAAMWGPSMVGFGNVPYTNTLGTNEWFVVGFAPRKAALTMYGIHNGYEAPDPLLDELGPHTTGKSCVYVKKLDQIDLGVLEQLVRKPGSQRPRPADIVEIVACGNASSHLATAGLRCQMTAANLPVRCRPNPRRRRGRPAPAHSRLLLGQPMTVRRAPSR